MTSAALNTVRLNMSVSSAGDSGVNKSTIGWIQWSHWLPPGRMSLCSDIISHRGEGGGVISVVCTSVFNMKLLNSSSGPYPAGRYEEGYLSPAFCLARSLSYARDHNKCYHRHLRTCWSQQSAASRLAPEQHLYCSSSDSF